jgi:hypothetical protein
MKGQIKKTLAILLLFFFVGAITASALPYSDIPKNPACKAKFIKGYTAAYDEGSHFSAEHPGAFFEGIKLPKSCYNDGYMDGYSDGYAGVIPPWAKEAREKEMKENENIGKITSQTIKR